MSVGSSIAQSAEGLSGGSRRVRGVAYRDRNAPGIPRDRRGCGIITWAGGTSTQLTRAAANALDAAVVELLYEAATSHRDERLQAQE